MVERINGSLENQKPRTKSQEPRVKTGRGRRGKKSRIKS